MHPLPEYPRPSMRRDSYVNLNGPWDYAITQSSEFPAKWDGAILVPYSPEAKASGVSRTLQPGQWLHYHRTFTPPAGEGGRVLLHFGAVDYACAVEVNGRLAGGHRGGYWPSRWTSPTCSARRDITPSGWPCRTPPAPERRRGESRPSGPAGCSTRPRAASGRRSGWSGCLKITLIR